LSFRQFASEARDLVSEAVRELGYPVPSTIEWDEPPAPELGDASFRIGYQLAKSAGKKPAQISGEIAEKIENELKSQFKLVEKVEAHPSGFLNFWINRSRFFETVLLEARNSGYGSLDLGGGKSALVEHTAVNPNKALHVGHLRNVALGDCIARILRFTNHSVKVLNYIDDSGLQVADVLVGFLYLGFPRQAPPGKKYDHYAGDDVYVAVNKRYDTDPSLKEKQKLVLKAIEERDKDIFPTAVEITDAILKEQLKTCWRFNASYDLFVYESDIIRSKLWEDTFSELKTKGIAKLEKEGMFAGCWIVTIKGEKEGEDKVLVRSDGTATYVAKDIPFAALKVGLIPDRFYYSKYSTEPDGHQIWRTESSGKGGTKSPVVWGADISITAIGIEQGRLQRVILRILEQLAGGADLSRKYVHLGYSLVTLSRETASSLSGTSTSAADASSSEGSVRMAGRKGIYINADVVMDALKSKAMEETKKRNPEESDQGFFDSVSEKLAISALRFSLLKQDLDKTITFDLEESLKLVGETGPYMLYTYARATNILSKIAEQSRADKIRADLLVSNAEQNLVLLLSKFDIYVEKCVKMLAPKWIAHSSFELCESFNKFYEANRVLQEPNPDLRSARIELVRSFQNVLKSALGLLGIEVLPKI
jgi:arginyl-tRNA synthetase